MRHEYTAFSCTHPPSFQSLFAVHQVLPHIMDITNKIFIKFRGFLSNGCRQNRFSHRRWRRRHSFLWRPLECPSDIMPIDENIPLLARNDVRRGNVTPVDKQDAAGDRCPFPFSDGQVICPSRALTFSPNASNTADKTADDKNGLFFHNHSPFWPCADPRKSLFIIAPAQSAFPFGHLVLVLVERAQCLF